MKLAIMQPYFLPYLGYFQLINSVDEFVLYDNVQFISQGWVNRNSILVNSSPCRFVLPLESTSHQANINERTLASKQWEREKGKLLKTIEQNYRKAKHFETVFPVVKSCLEFSRYNMAEFNRQALSKICKFCEIDTPLLSASELADVDVSKTGAAKVIAICQARGASHYINAFGGQDLYHNEYFQTYDLELSFLKPAKIVYKQFQNEFVPSLSIIDVMMFNSVEKIKEFLNYYTLVKQ